MKFKYSKLKYFFDYTFSFILLLILSPILIVLSILVLIKLGSPVFFIQTRPGYKNRLFNLIKFRSMKNEYDNKGNILPDNERLTSFGIWLRSTSFDELPSLINVLRGQMSFVGPRPLLVEYLNLYTLKEATRHNMKPGITGLAQIKGRNSISWSSKFKYDIFYVQKYSLKLDLYILFQTFFKVLKKESINYNNFSTMPKLKRKK